ncbi:MAG TPA: lipoyl synthase [Candidatus Paceibacterota bacterium]|nr:lipoyl synthase [Verrucomicrobiota bacterium]HOX03817.1 lipoyl synthase [Verrucomicrobiota bacterium]HRZ94844.1 lipoyl synthase [Candidatus Paceibacterota bacterium]
MDPDRIEAAAAGDGARQHRRLPEWLRRSLPAGNAHGSIRTLVDELRLHTVCQSARCPNQRECWSRGAATFMIAGDRCTRSCRFCSVQTAPPLPLDAGEPARVAEAAVRLGLRHVVITSVTRDDLEDGGAGHFQDVIRAVRDRLPDAVIEVLVPDFQDRPGSIAAVIAARPHVFNHNLETVRRLTPAIRSRASYDRSLSVLARAWKLGAPDLATKSGLMLGLGETEDEVLEAMRDLRSADVRILTLGQYLQPTPANLPVAEYIAPDRFADLRAAALDMGFRRVAAGPLVRSSYRAADAWPGGAPAKVESNLCTDPKIKD